MYDQPAPAANMVKRPSLGDLANTLAQMASQQEGETRNLVLQLVGPERTNAERRGPEAPVHGGEPNIVDWLIVARTALERQGKQLAELAEIVGRRG